MQDFLKGGGNLGLHRSDPCSDLLFRCRSIIMFKCKDNRFY